MNLVGNIYRVDVDADTVRYFWYVGKDIEQLGSALIVVFKRAYPKSSVPDLDEITADTVDFYCHAFIRIGSKLGYWSKIGFKRVTRIFPMLFWLTGDAGNLEIKTSENCYVWKPNEPYRRVGRLTGDLLEAEMGLVFAPHNIVNRIRTGIYSEFDASYEAAQKSQG